MAPRVWMVIWVDEHGRGHGRCGHRHATEDDAIACPFEPDDLPVVCAGLVRTVRDPAYTAPERALAAAKARLVAAGRAMAPQLELALGAG